MYLVVMKMQEKLPKRKKIRLQNYDYSECGAYFITICTERRGKILSKIVGDAEGVVPYDGGDSQIRFRIKKIGQ